MDNVKGAFERVLRKLVVPMFPKISDVSIDERAVTHDIITTYYINDTLDYSESLKVSKETNALFDMMGFEKVYNPWVTYRYVEEDKGGK